MGLSGATCLGTFFKKEFQFPEFRARQKAPQDHERDNRSCAFSNFSRLFDCVVFRDLLMCFDFCGSIHQFQTLEVFLGPPPPAR